MLYFFDLIFLVGVFLVEFVKNDEVYDLVVVIVKFVFKVVDVEEDGEEVVFEE